MPVIGFSKYQSAGTDFVLVADPGERRSFLAEHASVISSRSFGIGASALLRVIPDEAGADLAVDDSGSEYRNMWLSPAWDAALRTAAVFARDESLVRPDVFTISMRASGHHVGVVTVEVLEGSLVRLEVGAPHFGLGDEQSPATSPVSRMEVEVPTGFDPGDDWWALEDEQALTLPVIPVTLRERLHAVIFKEDVERIFRYVGPPSCLSPGVAVGPTRKLICDNPPFAGSTRPVLDLVSIVSSSHIEVGGASPWRHEHWRQGEGVCAAVAVARALAGMQERVHASVGTAEFVVEWPGSMDDNRPVTATAGATRVFEGRLLDVDGRNLAENRRRLESLLP